MNEKQQGPMIYLSRKACLDENPIKMYDALLKLQRSVGCTFRKLMKNDRQFDRFIGQAYLKAMTDYVNGRTVLLLGKDQHGVAGQGYFNIDPDPYTNKTGKGFENLVRWAHLGNSIRTGIILVDFEQNGQPNLGNARNFAQVQDNLEHICKLGIDKTKKVYLTDCVRIYEPIIGLELRISKGLITLNDWLKYDFSDIRRIAEKSIKKDKEISRSEKDVITRVMYRDREPIEPPIINTHYTASSALTESWG